MNYDGLFYAVKWAQTEKQSTKSTDLSTSHSLRQIIQILIQLVGWLVCATAKARTQKPYSRTHHNDMCELQMPSASN